MEIPKGWEVMAEKLGDLWHQREKSGMALELLPRLSILASSLCLILSATTPKSLGQSELGEPSASHWVGGRVILQVSSLFRLF